MSHADRRTWAVLGGTTLLFLVASPLYTVTGDPIGGTPAAPVLAVLPVAAAIGAIHLHHALAVSRHRRPTAWPWTSLALLALVYLPIPFWGFNWAATQLFVTASALLLIRPAPLAVVVGAAPALAMVGLQFARFDPSMSGLEMAWIAVYWLFGFALAAGALAGSAVLMRALHDLDLTRAATASAAIDEERMRLSRDLHDLLGQSLSAISLKGDLAAALLSRAPESARRQLDELAELADEALSGIRTTIRDVSSLSLPAEIAGLAALLELAGVRVESRVDERGPELPEETARMLATAVREAATNVLRHSAARTCRLSFTRRADLVRLEIVNDGVHAAGPPGAGLAGLAERAGGLGGRVIAERRGGTFVLRVDVHRPRP